MSHTTPAPKTRTQLIAVTTIVVLIAVLAFLFNQWATDRKDAETRDFLEQFCETDPTC